MNRNRFYQLIFILFTVVLGIASRKYGSVLPSLIADYAPDIFWALMVFLLAGLVFPSKSTLWIAIVSLLLSYFIELTQLYHSHFIDSIRATILGGLVLGYTFIWSDLLCYTVGVFIGVAIEKVLYPSQSRSGLVIF